MLSNKIDEQKIFFGIGRRKTSIAKVILVPGAGLDFFIKNKTGEEYLQYNLQYINASKAPLISLDLQNTYNIYANVHGGGIRAQADALKLGVARALCQISLSNRSLLKKYGYFTRDYRAKERKKYGLKKARKASQYSKR